MKIKSVKISNYRGLKDVELKSLGKLNVLLGKNGSGKTSSIECLDLFFRELDPLLEKPASVPDHVWYDENTNLEILIEIGLEFNSDEFDELIPEKMMQIIEDADKNQIKIVRKLGALDGRRVWHTESINIGKLEIVVNNKISAAFDEKFKGLSSAQTTKPENELNTFLVNLSSKTKNKFKFVPPTRDQFIQVSAVGERNVFLDNETQNAIRNLSQSTKADEKKIWRQIKRNTLEVLGLDDVEISSNQIYMAEGSKKLPVHLFGGGQQEILSVIRYVEEFSQKGVSIFAIEEPEMHLHPEAQRKLFEYMKLKSENGIQLFITSHSPIFINKKNPENVWLFKKDDKITKVEGIESKEKLKEVIIELGALPSDVLLTDKIVFVEGDSDKIFFSKIAATLGVDLQDRVTLIPLQGVNNSRHNIKFWLEIAKNANLPVFLIMDGGKQSEIEIKELIGQGLINKNNIFKLQKGMLEDYYLSPLLEKSLKELFGIDYKFKEGSNSSEQLVSLQAQKKLPKLWKVHLAEYMSNGVTLESIDEELKAIMGKIGV